VGELAQGITTCGENEVRSIPHIVVIPESSGLLKWAEKKVKVLAV
jgi:hypothetical protein